MYGRQDAVIALNLADADVVYVGHGAGPAANFSELVLGRGVVTVFVQCENFEPTAYGHQFIHSADVSLGSSAGVVAPNYLHTPCWMLCLLGLDPE